MFFNLTSNQWPLKLFESDYKGKNFVFIEWVTWVTLNKIYLAF
jgi:hypothetical protein